jgi:outer membrane protein assembly factor BamB
MLPIPSGNFASVWRAQLPLKNTQVKSLAVNDETVFVYTANNGCIWLSREGGAIKSIMVAAPLHDTLFPPITLPSRVVFLATSQFSVYERQTGKLLNITPLRYSASSAGAGDKSTIYFGVDHPNGGRVIAMTTEPKVGLLPDKHVPYDITPNWELYTGGQVLAAPAVMQDQVYSGSRDGRVYAVRGENRDVLWPGLDSGSFKTDGGILANLAVDKDGVYVSSLDSKLYSLRPSDGRLAWSYHAGRPLRDSVAVPTLSTVYLFVSGTGIVAIEKGGTQEIRSAKWAVKEGVQFLSSDDKFAYLRTADNGIIAVDKASGQTKFASKRKDFTIFATNTSDKDNSIFAGKPDGTIYRIHPVLKPGTIGEWVMDFEQSPVELAAK